MIRFFVHPFSLVLWPAAPRLPRKYGLRYRGPTWTWRPCRDPGCEQGPDHGHGYFDHRPSWWDVDRAMWRA